MFRFHCSSGFVVHQRYSKVGRDGRVKSINYESQKPQKSVPSRLIQGPCVAFWVMWFMMFTPAEDFHLRVTTYCARVAGL
ncbi:hypothetical protein NDU88_008691 [Pleurodeles waltl]|uniref:Uncharacterized protein n=1 Tax=Pleurodeles waltl TaxID=8319 RepID=A0AAV7NXA0_PLEWA|nr:hypothetical protein NDU88_008691 [Pleurodeles waltl]